jgi:hypothetical protein
MQSGRLRVQSAENQRLPVFDAALRGIHGFAGGKDLLGIGLAETGPRVVPGFRDEVQDCQARAVQRAFQIHWVIEEG